MFGLTEILIAAILALIFSVTGLSMGVYYLNKEAKEKGSSEKGYDFWSVVSGFLIAFVTSFFLIFYELFLKSGKGR